MKAMRASGAVMAVRVLLVVVLLAVVSTVRAEAVVASGLLTTDYYARSCPRLSSIVKEEVQKAVKVEKRMAASLVRLHFHDCFVHGCDGSILLDDTATFIGEKTAAANNNSARGFEVIDGIKAKLEEACPITVSCADILALASRDSAVEVGLSESYPVFVGRLDSLNASRDEANLRLPSPRANYSELKENFEFQGLNEVDLIALSGAHTIGKVRCEIVRIFLNDTDTNAEFRSNLAEECPAGGDNFKLQNLDLKTPEKFDNNYFNNLRRGEGIIRSDQTLWSTPGINQAIVWDFARNQETFFQQFAFSTIKMGNIRPPAGTNGEIRKNCRAVNSAPLVASE
jgi:peroxidase